MPQVRHATFEGIRASVNSCTNREWAPGAIRASPRCGAPRAALIIPPVFAFNTLVLHDGQNVIFAVFGCFALLVMSDFGGQRPARALAYLIATFVGAVLVTVGTLASASAGLAAGVTFVVGFSIAFSRVFGGYVAAAQTGMLLSFVIAVSIPAPASAIPARVGGPAGGTMRAPAAERWPW